jgi:hypothetical protein
MKDKFVLVIISIIAMYLVFRIGYLSGYSNAQPTQEQVKASQDLYVVVDSYSQLYELCEEKYQLGIQGKFNEAFELKGKMLEIQQDIDEILVNY